MPVLAFSSVSQPHNLDSILRFPGKSIVYLYIWLKWIQIRIRDRQAMNADPIPKNDVDPIGSGSTTVWKLFKNVAKATTTEI